jgi:hypothetical protein
MIHANYQRALEVMTRYLDVDPNYISLSDSGPMPHDFVIFTGDELPVGELPGENRFHCPHPFCIMKDNKDFRNRFTNCVELIRHWNDYHVAVTSYYSCPLKSCRTHPDSILEYSVSDAAAFKVHLQEKHHNEVKALHVSDMIITCWHKLVPNRRYIGTPNMEWCDKPLYDHYVGVSIDAQELADEIRRKLGLPAYNHSMLERAYQEHMLPAKTLNTQFLVKWQVAQYATTPRASSHTNRASWQHRAFRSQGKALNPVDVFPHGANRGKVSGDLIR